MNNINLTLKIERAISELRRGSKVVITDNNNNLSILITPAELIRDDTVDEFSKLAKSRPNILLSPTRCKAIGINTDNKPCSILINKNWNYQISCLFAYHYLINKNQKSVVLFQKAQMV